MYSTRILTPAHHRQVVHISARVAPEVVDALDAIAAVRGWSRAKVVGLAVERLVADPVEPVAVGWQNAEVR